ncbi:MAG TPA: VWA domain-containing protein [Thermoanaerobaculia bacterium]|nr:VWA domain-containing protein [Thermoanaerobaculia bacterium]
MRSLALAVLLSFYVAPAVLPAPELSKREQKDRIAQLAEGYQQFLLDVSPIIAPVERNTFLTLETDPQRDLFIEDFWTRRDKLQGTTNQAFRKRYYDRLDVVKEKFHGASTDRGKTYLTRGEPADILELKCPRRIRPIEIWTYPGFADQPEYGHPVQLIFYLPQDEREWVLFDPRKRIVSELFKHDKIYDGAARARLDEDCNDLEKLSEALDSAKANQDRLYKLYDPPAIDTEMIAHLAHSVVIANPQAPKIEPRVTVAYPGAENGKTDMRWTIDVPRSAVKPAVVNEAKSYGLDVVGELIRDDRMWETFRYRFDLPAETAGDLLPLVIDRMLPPGAYTARVKVSDRTSGAEGIIERPLEVPSVAPAILPAKSGEIAGETPAIRIIPLPDALLSGVYTVETLIAGDATKSVEFWLDGKKIAVRRSPPFSLDLDLGMIPQAHRIRVIADDAEGKPLGGDEVVVNSGTDPFRVRITSPRVTPPRIAGRTRVTLDVRLPKGHALAGVDVFWNETKVATLHDPPYVQTINAGSGKEIGSIRAVATLDDGSTAEDEVIVNAPAQLEEVNVHLVELPTTVISHGRPLNSLDESAFKAFDEGKPVKLAKFEHVKDLPLSLGLAIDTSGSMLDRMEEARTSAAEFFKNVLRKGDKAFLISFDTQPHVVQTWSSNLGELETALATLRAEEATSLYDAIVYSLYNFMGVKGQKVLVVITDGRDTTSQFTLNQALEYARRSAVPIYAIAIGIEALDLDVKHQLARFCNETGGNLYSIDSASELGKIYEDIENELRSQYILGFYPSSDVKPGGKWHDVTVQVSQGHAKTIRGYYP